MPVAGNVAVVDHVACAGIEAVKAIQGADPEVAFPVFGDDVDEIVAKAVPFASVVAGEFARLLVEMVEASAPSADPERPILGDIDTLDVVAGEGVGVARVVEVGLELVAVPAVQAVLRAEPHIAKLVLHNGLDVVARFAVWQFEELQVEAI